MEPIGTHSFSNYILHPLERETGPKKVIALISSILIAVSTLGAVHLLAYIFTQHKEPFLNTTEQKTSEVFEKNITLPVETEQFSEEAAEDRIAKGRLTLEDLPLPFRDLEKILLAAVKQDGFALRFASERLKANKEIVLAAVQNNGLAIQFATREMRGNEEIGLEAIGENIEAFQYLAKSLKDNPEFKTKVEMIINDQNRL